MPDKARFVRLDHAGLNGSAPIWFCVLMKKSAGSAVATATLLSAASGCTDALAFLLLGNVFTSAMSGNTVLFAIALGTGHAAAASHSLAALFGYCAGVAAVTRLLVKPGRLRHALLAEIVFLAAFALLWIFFHPADPGLYAAILLSALAMGFQGAIGRELRIPNVPTIVFTSTLTAIVATLAARRRDDPVLPPPTGQQLGVYLAYFAAAGLAAALHGFTASALLPLAAVVLALLLLNP